jgi:hypothetical protein
MGEALRDQLAALGDEVQAAALPDDCQHTALWCVGQLPALYAQYCLTSESRYGEEITRLVRGVLKELARNQKVWPGAAKLAADVTDRLRLLHQEFGLPGLNLKPLGAPPPCSRKAG